MAAVSDYPPDPVAAEDMPVIGDQVTIAVEIVTDEDITEWTWAAEVRRFPSWPVLATFTITTDPDVTKGLLLTLTEAESANLRDGCGFSLKRTDPDPITWWVCPQIHMVKAYTEWPLESA